MVQKIVSYAQVDPGAWSSTMTLVADTSDAEDFDFVAATARLRALVPSGYSVSSVLRGEVGTASARETLFAGINAGEAIVNYAGHGSVDLWHDDLLTTEDAPTFTNGAKLPIFVMMDCLNGFFQGLYPEESLAEAMVRADHGGAVAVWASSGFTNPRDQAPLNAAFFRLLFSKKFVTVGEVINAAKLEARDRDVRRTWILFGDPAMRFKGQ
jgi:hypothetical protein